jgi:hypothetical protein
LLIGAAEVTKNLHFPPNNAFVSLKINASKNAWVVLPFKYRLFSLLDIAKSNKNRFKP